MEKFLLCILPFMIRLILVVLISSLLGCQNQPDTHKSNSKRVHTTAVSATQKLPYDTAITTIHLYVALCDNKYQGIVPVPAAIGNGQDPISNLYWGCGFGVRSYFKKSSQWKLVKQYAVDSLILERLIFKHNGHNAYLIADAYNGRYIQQCTINFLKSCAGAMKDTLHVQQQVIGSSGNARLLAYIGHDGLMDFKISEAFSHVDDKKRDAIMLACYSRNFFWKHLINTNANPLVWTTGLMCPEAYTLHDAFEDYLNKKSVADICNSAALAYSKYQKCSMKAAKGLLVSGW